MTGWTAGDMPRLDDRTVVVTGANSGLGREATRAFAQQGATVVMACRSTDRGTAAADELRREGPDGTLDVRACDLGALDSVAQFAAGVEEAYGAVDILCNNASVMAIPRRETADGFETQFGVNHLGHFALTAHLWACLRESDGEARVVTHASGVHEGGSIDFADLHSEQSYSRWGAYAQSKLANVLFATELDRRIRAADIEDVTSASCHPGWADTNLQFRGPEAIGSRLRAGVMRVANTLFAQSAAQGALPMLYVATHPDITGGEYVGPDGLFGGRGHPEVQRASDTATDPDIASRLWAVSAEQTGVTFPFDA